MTSNRVSLLLSIFLCVAGVALLLSSAYQTVRMVAAARSAWSEAILQGILWAALAAATVLEHRVKAKSRPTFFDSDWYAWIAVVLAAWLTPRIWRADHLPFLQLLLFILAGANFLSVGIRRFRRRGDEAQAASRPDSMAS